jgi:hypothetical protein
MAKTPAYSRGKAPESAANADAGAAIRSAARPGRAATVAASALAGASMRAAAPAQLAGRIAGSPRMVAQRQQLRSIFGGAVQMKEPEEDGLLQGRFETAQRIGEEEELLQRRPAPAENRTGLPDNLKAGIESLSGIDMSDVRVHPNSSKPAQLSALAYAQGTDIHLAPGQEKHLPHEAWHLVQQKQGRVRPTMQMTGVGINGEAGLEQEASLKGEQAVKMKIRDRRLHHTDLTRLPPPQQAWPPLSRATHHCGSPMQRRGILGTVPVIQRVVSLAGKSFARDIQKDNKKWYDWLTAKGIYGAFLVLHNDRDNIYNFTDAEDLERQLKQQAGVPPIAAAGAGAGLHPSPSPPKGAPVATKTLNQAHENAQEWRFAQLNQPAPEQLPDSAPGAHAIPGELLPRTDDQSMYVRQEDRWVIFRDRRTSTSSTAFRTFGDPNKPSMVTSQDGQALGILYQSAAPAFTRPIARNGRYAGHKAEAGWVRGHPALLEGNQPSTDAKGLDMDSDPTTYTKEQDGTGDLGGVSTWRYSQVEKPTLDTGGYFLQQNVGLGAPSSSGMAAPAEIWINMGGQKMLLPNDGKHDYKGEPPVLDPKRKPLRSHKRQTHHAMARALARPYPEPKRRKQGDDYKPAGRESVPGYRSPPPSPFIATIPLYDAVSLSGKHYVSDRLMYNGEACMISGVQTVSGVTTYTLLPLRDALPASPPPLAL